MVKMMLDLTKDESKALAYIKLKNDLSSKQEAIKHLIQKYEGLEK